LCRQVQEQKPCQPGVIWIFSDLRALSYLFRNVGKTRGG
jgi:hypothetical protein